MANAAIVLEGNRQSPLFFSCEHASERIPDEWSLPETDKRLRGTHWAYDLGAALLTRELARAFDSTAVLANFSRLLIDPNRALTQENLFRDRAENKAIELNTNLSEKEKTRRIKSLYTPFHQSFRDALYASEAEVALSLHSFTPLYEGKPRTLEVGILFNQEEALAATLFDAFKSDGFDVAMNEPYSGKEGLMHSVEHHCDALERKAIELEFRNDLLANDSFRKRIAAALASVFS